MYGLGSSASISCISVIPTLSTTCIGAVSMFRVAMKDFTFSDGLFVPKGAFISATASAIHKDPEYYGEDADVFNPWRFADIRDVDGAESVKHQLVATGAEYIPFGHGRHAWYVRPCILQPGQEADDGLCPQSWPILRRERAEVHDGARCGGLRREARGRRSDPAAGGAHIQHFAEPYGKGYVSEKAVIEIPNDQVSSSTHTYPLCTIERRTLYRFTALDPTVDT